MAQERDEQVNLPTTPRPLDRGGVSIPVRRTSTPVPKNPGTTSQPSSQPSQPRRLTVTKQSRNNSLQDQPDPNEEKRRIKAALTATAGALALEENDYINATNQAAAEALDEAELQDRVERSLQEAQLKKEAAQALKAEQDKQDLEQLAQAAETDEGYVQGAISIDTNQRLVRIDGIEMLVDGQTQLRLKSVLRTRVKGQTTEQEKVTPTTLGQLSRLTRTSSSNLSAEAQFYTEDEVRRASWIQATEIEELNEEDEEPDKDRSEEKPSDTEETPKEGDEPYNRPTSEPKPERPSEIEEARKAESLAEKAEGVSKPGNLIENIGGKGAGELGALGGEGAAAAEGAVAAAEGAAVAAEGAAVVAEAAVATAAAVEAAPVLAIIGGILVFVIAIVLIVMALTASNPASAGTLNESLPINTTSTLDTTLLNQVLAGGTVTTELAQAILTKTESLRLQFTDARNQSILNDIAAAAQAIIDNDKNSKDPAVAEHQSALLKQKIEQFKSINTPKGCIGATYCLPVPGVAEGSESLCGITSMVMLMLYYDPQYNDTAYYRQDQRYARGGPRSDGVKITDPDADNLCPGDTYFTNHVTDALKKSGRLPADAPKDQWGRKSFARVPGGKDTIIQYMKESLKNGDPLILYVNQGGIFPKSKHLVVVVGYAEKDEPDKGGTFIINNPDIGIVTTQTRYAITGNGRKLTADYIKQYMGGGSGGDYNNSIIIRLRNTQ